MKAGGELKRPPVMSSGLPGLKLIVYELPRPGLHRLALASEGRESKLLFHQRNKNAVAAGTHSSVSRQLALSPMRIFAGWIERALDVPVQRSHDPDAREHCRPLRARRSTRDSGAWPRRSARS